MFDLLSILCDQTDLQQTSDFLVMNSTVLIQKRNVDFKGVYQYKSIAGQRFEREVMYGKANGT